jgi:hypothetical protein
LFKNFQAFKPYLRKIIDFTPKEPYESNHFIRVLSIIIRNCTDDSDLIDIVLKQLNNLNPCPEMAQLYNFLGRYELSIGVLENLLKNEYVLPYAINLMLDLHSVQFEFAIESKQPINLEEYFQEIDKLQSMVETFSTDNTTDQNFKFKQANFQARLNLYNGFLYLQDGNETSSHSKFNIAKDLYSQLKSTKVIKEDTKNLFEVYYKIADFFQNNCSSIINKLNQDVNDANVFIQESLNSTNIQISRFTKEIKKLHFDLHTKKIYNITCEIPTKFCPKPPIIIKKEIYGGDNELLREWDENNDVILSEPILIRFGSQKLTLILEFKEKDKFYDYKVKCHHDNDQNVNINKIKDEPGKIIFELYLNSDIFVGIRNLTLEFRENDLCGSSFELSLRLVHENYIRLENEILSHLTRKIEKYKGKTIERHEYIIFLDQITNSKIRSGILKNILKRIPDYTTTLEDMVLKLKNLVNRVYYEDNDDIILCILDSLWNKSPTFCGYLVENYIPSGRYKITVEKSSILLKNLKKKPPLKKTFIIFLDDTIGFGKQFIDCYNKDFKPFYESFDLKNNSLLNFYLIALYGSIESFENISQNTILKKDNIRYNKILRNSDKAFNPEVWNDKELLEEVKRFLSEIDDKFWDGYKPPSIEKGLEYLVVNEWGVPNNTIGCLWHKKSNWDPIFPRS